MTSGMEMRSLIRSPGYTPHLNQMAAEGSRFIDAQPVHGVHSDSLQLAHWADG